MAGDEHEEIPLLKDYRKLKEENYYVVDKSLMIYGSGSEVTLITRPSAFTEILPIPLVSDKRRASSGKNNQYE
mgnify:CR=1 FL=1